MESTSQVKEAPHSLYSSNLAKKNEDQSQSTRLIYNYSFEERVNPSSFSILSNSLPSGPSVATFLPI